MSAHVVTGPTDLFAGVNQAMDPANLSDLEKKHLPVIDAPETVVAGTSFDVTIEVGALLAHPNETGHSIQYIELLADQTFVARVDLTAGRTEPKVCLRVCLDGQVHELRALARCNLHGVWAQTRKITVTS